MIDKEEKEGLNYTLKHFTGNSDEEIGILQQEFRPLLGDGLNTGYLAFKG